MSIHYGMDRAAYDKLKGVNFSSLKLMAKSPAHYMHNLQTPREDTPALRLGRCIHLAVLEPEQYMRQVAVWDGDARRGKLWDAFKDANAGKELLTEEEHARCLAVSSAVRLHPVAGSYVSGGQTEVSIQWQHEEPELGGVPALSMALKGRPDRIDPSGFITDLKSTRDASPEAFARAVYEYKIHVQCAWYVDGYEAETGKRLPAAVVAVESAAPHAVVVYQVPEDLLDLGRETYRCWLRQLEECRTTNQWPSYAATEVPLALPYWAAPRDDSEEDVGGLGLVIGGGA